MYNKTIKLRNNEVAAKLNVETGELTTIKNSVNNIPSGKSIFSTESFSKLNCNAIPVLRKCFNAHEIAIIFQMIHMSEFHTNCLIPLSNSTTQKELAETFGVGKNQIQKYLTHLFNLGVFAQFKISKYGLKEYWILNPYISFKGKVIEDSIFINFQNTEITNLIIANTQKIPHKGE